MMMDNSTLSEKGDVSISKSSVTLCTDSFDDPQILKFIFMLVRNAMVLMGFDPHN